MHQIDQLGVELDSYCRTLKPVMSSGIVDNLSSGIGSSNVSLDNNVLMQQKQAIGEISETYASFSNQAAARVRYRPDNIRPPPPLPERR